MCVSPSWKYVVNSENMTGSRVGRKCYSAMRSLGVRRGVGIGWPLKLAGKRKVARVLTSIAAKTRRCGWAIGLGVVAKGAPFFGRQLTRPTIGAQRVASGLHCERELPAVGKLTAFDGIETGELSGCEVELASGFDKVGGACAASVTGAARVEAERQ